MNHIEEFLKHCEIMHSELSGNAFDLFMKGHLTEEQFRQVQFGEEVRMAETARERNENQRILLTSESMLGEDFRVPQRLVDQLKHSGHIQDDKEVELSAIIKRCVDTIDNTLARIMPNQIDHVVINAKREKKMNLTIDGCIIYKVVIRLIDIKKQTTQTIGTNIPIELAYFISDDHSWEYFQRRMQEQFQMIVLQLIQAIKADRVSQIGQEK